MLYLMRKPNESIIINNCIELKVIEIKGKSVKLGFTFPKGASVLRKELHDKILKESFGGVVEATGQNTDTIKDVSTLALDQKTRSLLGESGTKEEVSC